MAENDKKALPPGTTLEWEEDGPASRLTITPLAAENSLGHRVLAWPDPLHQWRNDRVFVPERGGRRVVTHWRTDASKADLEHRATDLLWEAELRIRKFIDISPSTTRERAILYLFAPGAEIASQVKLAERRCDTRDDSAWRQGAVVGAVGGVVIGAAVNRLITWLKK